MWFSSWQDVGRIGISGIVAFTALLALVRLCGNRTIATLNASDFILTVAMGSTVAAMLTSSSLPIASGVAALATLVGLQFVTLWLSVRAPKLRQQAEGGPRLLLHGGAPDERAMTRALVSRDELRQVLRQEGYTAFEQVYAVVLEANGQFSVIETGDNAGEPLEEVLRRTVRSQRK